MHRYALALVALFALSCGGGQKPTDAPESPTPPTPEQPAAAASETPAASASASSTAEAKPPEEKKPVAKELGAPASTSSPGGKPVCSKLPKSTCKVTNGCAWSEQNKCVDEGA